MDDLGSCHFDPCIHSRMPRELSSSPFALGGEYARYDNFTYTDDGWRTFT
jgi:hypothetical protein